MRRLGWYSRRLRSNRRRVLMRTRSRRSRRHRHARHVLMRTCGWRSRRHRHARHVLMRTRSGRSRRHRHARHVLMWSRRWRGFRRSRLARGTPWLSSRRAFSRGLFRGRLMRTVIVLRVNDRAAEKEQRYPQHPNNSDFPVSNNYVHDQSYFLTTNNERVEGRGLHDRAPNKQAPIATVWSCCRSCACCGSSRMNRHRSSIRDLRTS